MGVARSAPKGAYYHADIIGNKKGSKELKVFRVRHMPKLRVSKSRHARAG